MEEFERGRCRQMEETIKMVMNANQVLKDHIAILEYRLIGYEQEIAELKEREKRSD